MTILVLALALRRMCCSVSAETVAAFQKNRIFKDQSSRSYAQSSKSSSGSMVQSLQTVSHDEPLLSLKVHTPRFLSIRCPQSRFQVFSSRDDNTAIPRLRLMSLHNRARDRIQLGIVQRVTKVCNAIPLRRRRIRRNHAMNGALQVPIRPVTQQITDIDQNRNIRLRSGIDGNGAPRLCVLQDLEAGLTLELEEQRHGAVVAVGTAAEVACGVVLVLWLYLRVVEEAQDAAGLAAGQVVVRREPILAALGWVDSEAECDDFQHSAAYTSTGLCECVHVSLTWSQCIWKALLWLSIDKLVYVECSDIVGDLAELDQLDTYSLKSPF